MLRDGFVAWDTNIFFSKYFLGSNPSSADNRALYNVRLLMNHPVESEDIRNISRQDLNLQRNCSYP